MKWMLGWVVLAVSAVGAELRLDRAAVECAPRGGWPDFVARARAGERLKVAYLGGSITAQPGWRVKSLAWLKTVFPQATLTEINAAIGGTGSDLGVLRLEHDVLAKAPDLLFVEFAVNDSGAEPREIVRAMEGIVRKTWARFPRCDIAFVYTFTERLLPELKAGKLNRSAAAMEAVAEHYGIPTIHLGLEAVKLERAGRLLMKAPEAKVERVSGDELNVAAGVPVGADGKIPFSKDGVHPYVDTGHALYQAALVRSWPAIERASVMRARTLPAQLDPESYTRTAMVALDGLKRTGAWTRLARDEGLGKNFAARVESLWQAEPGAELTFTFRGSAAKVYDVQGPDGGSIEITVDGVTKTMRRIDGYCTYSRLSLVTVATGLDPAREHTVRIRVLDTPLAKREILFEHNRPDFDQHPAKYAPLRWQAGAVLVIGDGVF